VGGWKKHTRNTYTHTNTHPPTHTHTHVRCAFASRKVLSNAALVLMYVPSSAVTRKSVGVGSSPKQIKTNVCARESEIVCVCVCVCVHKIYIDTHTIIMNTHHLFLPLPSTTKASKPLLQFLPRFLPSSLPLFLSLPPRPSPRTHTHTHTHTHTLTCQAVFLAGRQRGGRFHVHASCRLRVQGPVGE
jgi:hypothetical protein